MKTRIVILCLVGLASCSQAQKGIPARVTESFSKQFPTASKVKWEKEDANFEAEFKQGDQEYSAVFNAQGQLQETEQEIAVSALPQAVQNYLAEHYAGKKIKEAAKITLADGTVKYEAEINGKDLLFDANGNLIP